MESRVESKRGKESLQSDPPRVRPIALFVFPWHKDLLCKHYRSQKYILKQFWTNTGDKVSVLHCHGRLELRAGRRGGEESSQCISSLASGTLKRCAGRGGEVGRHTRAKDCQRRNKKEGEMMKKLPVGVNSYKHRHLHSTAVCPQSLAAVLRSFSEQDPCCATCSTGAAEGQIGYSSYADQKNRLFVSEWNSTRRRS